MAQFIPVSKTSHAASAWLRPPHYGFSAGFDVVSLLADEMAQMLPALPLAFKRRENAAANAGYQLVALFSPLAGRNLFVKPDGSWLPDYVPILLRAYPFCLLTAAQSGERVVCFDRASGLLTDAGTPGSIRFFTEVGEPGPEFTAIIGLLQHYEQRRALTQRAVDTLAELNLITPWNLVVKDESGREQEGAVKVCKIDGAALQKLPADQLVQLHACGALMIAHAQLLSEPRVQHFGQLLQKQISAQPPQTNLAPPTNLDALLASRSDMLRFDNL
jgi:hypothetical protein